MTSFLKKLPAVSTLAAIALLGLGSTAAQAEDGGGGQGRNAGQPGQQ